MSKNHVYRKMHTPSKPFVTGPRGYDKWVARAADLRAIVEQRLRVVGPAVELFWRKGKNDRNRPITTDDLAAALFVVEVARPFGEAVSYSTLADAFGQIFEWKRSCPRNKAARVLAILEQLDLIRVTGRHKQHKHGTKYALTSTAMDADLTLWLG